jgi:hypothetical protein
VRGASTGSKYLPSMSSNWGAAASNRSSGSASAKEGKGGANPVRQLLDLLAGKYTRRTEPEPEPVPAAASSDAQPLSSSSSSSSSSSMVEPIQTAVQPLSVEVQARVSSSGGSTAVQDSPAVPESDVKISPSSSSSSSSSSRTVQPLGWPTCELQSFASGTQPLSSAPSLSSDSSGVSSTAGSEMSSDSSSKRTQAVKVPRRPQVLPRCATARCTRVHAGITDCLCL